MDWHWGLFLGLLIPAFAVVAFSRGVMNSQNVERRGIEADYNYAFANRPGSIMTGTFLAGAIWSGLITAAVGFIF